MPALTDPGPHPPWPPPAPRGLAPPDLPANLPLGN